jgi:hypothetical protein
VVSIGFAKTNEVFKFLKSTKTNCLLSKNESIFCQKMTKNDKYQIISGINNTSHVPNSRSCLTLEIPVPPLPKQAIPVA